ncbi:uncharacterized protein V2V93DRAFT_367576 [Kockiozyma suomiensis]|uniref:uncharacterized protein n=1 Tax=Kockiozyma suomiensis TaxID=1337062 RepID=UPI003343BF27
MIATNFPLPSNRERVYEDCLPCRIISATGLMGAGGYMLFSSRFRNPASEFYREVKPSNIRFVHGSIKVVGAAMITFGILRAGDGIFWRQNTVTKTELRSSESSKDTH